VAFLRKIKAGLVKFPVDQYIGYPGQMFYNEDTGQLYISDGATVGGIPVTSSGGGGSGPSTTDDLPEGAGNLYYTQARAFDDIDQRVAAIPVDADTLDGFNSTYFGTASVQSSLISDFNTLQSGLSNLTNTVDNLDSDDINEGVSNFYYTQGRFNTAFDNKDTDALSEGSSNLYYTDGRVNTRIDGRVNKSFIDNLNVDADTLDGRDSTYFATASSVANLTTDEVAEGTNLYFTSARAITAVGGSVNDAGTGTDDIWSADKVTSYVATTTTGIQSTTGIAEANELVRTDSTGYLDASFISALDTDNLAEGSNLYYTDARANSAIDTRVTKAFVDALNVDADTLDGNDSTYFATKTSVDDLTTDDVAEGANLYYTDLRATTAVGGILDDTGTSTNDIWSADKTTNYVDQEVGTNGNVGVQVTGGSSDADKLMRTNSSGYLDASMLLGRSTSDLSEGSNQYFTDARAVTAVGGSVNDLGTATDDIWSADRVAEYVDEELGTGGNVGVQTSSGNLDANKLIRTNSNGYLAPVFLTDADTDNLAEGSNLYYTQARFDTAFGNKLTTNLTEGTNLYFTDARAVTAIGGTVNDLGLAADDIWSASKLVAYIEGEVGQSGDAGIQSTSGSSDSDTLIRTDNSGYLSATFLDGRSTTDLAEGSNLYYTQARFDAAFANEDTDELTEGTSNLYFTTARAITAVGGLINDAGTDTDDLWSANKITNHLDDNVGTGGTVGIQQTLGSSDGDKLIRTSAAGYLDNSLLTATTSDIPEGTALYYSQARFDTAFGNKSTTNLAEGANLYYTAARANSAIDTRVTKSFVDGLNVDAGTLDGLDSAYFASQSDLDNLTTDDIVEAGNLYFTNARAVSAIGGIKSDTGTGTNDLWSADKIVKDINNKVGTSGTVGVTSTSGAADGTKLIRTNSAGYLDATFLVGRSTTDLSEGTNLYYTQGRFDTALAGKNTNSLVEGNANLYYTDARANNAIDTRVTKSFVDALDVDADTLDGNDSAYFATAANLTTLDTTVANLTSDDITEGTTNLYYNQTRVDSRVDEFLKDYGFSNVLHVDYAPTGSNEFSSISDAIAEINSRGDAGPANAYAIVVGAGRFTDAPFTIPEHVTVTGFGSSTLLQPSTDSQDFITLSVNSKIANVKAEGPSDPSNYTIKLDTSVSGEAVVENLEFRGTWGILHAENTGAATVNLRLSTTNICSTCQFIRAFDISSTSTGIMNVIFDGLIHTIFSPLISINQYMLVEGQATTVILNDAVINAGAGVIDHALHVSNGATLIMTDVGVQNANVTLHVPNEGVGPYVRSTGLVSDANNYDLLVEHPDAYGSITGILGGDDIFVDPASTLTVSILSPTGDSVGQLLLGELFQGDRTARLVNLSQLVRSSSPVGYTHGGELTSAPGSNIVNVGSGKGYVVDSTDDTLLEIAWGDTTVTINPGEERWLLVNANSNLVASASPPDNLINFILLGRVYGAHGHVEFIEQIGSKNEHNDNKQTVFFRDALGPIFASGSIVSASTTPLQLNVSSGRFYYGELRFTPSGDSDVVFTEVYRTATTGYNLIHDAQAVPTAFDDGSGTLVSLGAGNYVKHSFYVVGDGVNETYFLVVGQDEFSNPAVAEQADLPLPPAFVKESFALLASVIVQEGNGIYAIIDERPVIGFKAGGVSASTTHGNLLGLSADDHPQYLRTDGSRTATGSIDMGANSISNVNQVNGVVVEAHAARHLPNGADPIATGTPSTVGTVNSEGILNALARQDHVHSHGDQLGGTLHAEVTQSIAGFMSAADKTLLDTISTDDVAEGSNLYFTDARAITAVGGSVNDLGIAVDDIWSADKVIDYVDSEVGTAGTVGIQTTTGVTDADKLIRTTATGYLEPVFLTDATTDDLSEGTNLYYTQARFDTALSNKTTTDVAEGTNLYFTDTRAVTAVKGSVDDLGTATDDIWSADKIISYINSEVGTDGAVGVQSTSGLTDADKLIRTDAAGYIDASFLIGRDTDDLSEGTNLYYTQARFNTAFANKDTDALSEGGANLYYTDARANSAIDVRVTKSFIDALDVDADTLDGFDSLYFATKASVDNLTTDEVAEGSDLYFTSARAVTAVGGSINDTGSDVDDIWSADRIANYVDIQLGTGGNVGIQSTTGATDADKIIRTDSSGYLSASFLASRDTDDLAEGTNLYYTQARFDTAFSNKSTTDLSEGTNLYFTDARAVTAIGGSVNDTGSDVDDIWSADKITDYVATEITGIQTTTGATDADKLIRTDSTGYLSASFLIGRDTGDLSEGSNLYYTDARANSAIDVRVGKAFVDALDVDADTLDGNDSTYFATKASVDNLTTDDVAEGSNLYFTDPRAVAAIGGSVDDAGTGTDDIWSADKITDYVATEITGIQTSVGVADADKLIRTNSAGYLEPVFLSSSSTSNLAEGTNLYYTVARANSAIDARVDKAFVDALNVDADTLDGNDSAFFATKSSVDNLTTDEVSEGSNLYFTDARAVTAVGGSVNDTGTDTNDLWSADRIAEYVGDEIAVIGTSSIQTTAGAADANKLIRTNSAGYLDATFLDGRSTTDLAEGTNLYYTSARFDTAFGNKSTTNLTEGTNLYFTDARATTAVGGSVNDAGTGTDDIWSADKIADFVATQTTGIQSTTGASNANEVIRTDSAGRLDASFLVGRSTSDLSEGTNLYYTQARFNTAFNSKDTDGLGEGTANLYFTQSRAINSVGGSINDTGTTTGDLWSANKINSQLGNYYLQSAFISTSAGAADASKPVVLDATGKIDSSLLPVSSVSKTVINAQDFDFTNNVDWTVSNSSSLIRDPVNQAIRTRAFDQSTDEGAGFLVDIPAATLGLTTIKFKVWTKRRTTGTGTNAVIAFFNRPVNTGAPVGPWNTTTAGQTTITGLSTVYQVNEVTVAISSLGLTAGTLHQFELVRRASLAADTLTGDLLVSRLEVSFS